MDLIVGLLSVQTCTTSPNSPHLACRGINLVDQASMTDSAVLHTLIELRHPRHSSSSDKAFDALSALTNVCKGRHIVYTS